MLLIFADQRFLPPSWPVARYPGASFPELQSSHQRALPVVPNKEPDARFCVRMSGADQKSARLWGAVGFAPVVQLTKRQTHPQRRVNERHLSVGI